MQVGCQFKILLYAFKLASLTSFESKILLNYKLKNEVTHANFNTYKRICNWQPFMKRVYRSPTSVLSNSLPLQCPGGLVPDKLGGGVWPGARFSKLPVITRPVKLFWFPFQMGVSKLLKAIQ